MMLFRIRKERTGGRRLRSISYMYSMRRGPEFGCLSESGFVVAIVIAIAIAIVIVIVIAIVTVIAIVIAIVIATRCC